MEHGNAGVGVETIIGESMLKSRFFAEYNFWKCFICSTFVETKTVKIWKIKR